eukprot:gene529-1182_t
MKSLELFAVAVTIIVGMVNVSQGSRKHQDEFLTFPTNIEQIKKHLKTDRPMVGILSMYIVGSKIKEQYPQTKNSSYIAASFVRFVEGAGARAVPIPENLSKKQVEKILKGVNAVIIPGGDVEALDVGYDRITKQILDYSIQQKKKGIIWPVLGINRGAERLALLVAKKEVTVAVSAMNLSMPLHLTAEANKSRLLKYAAKGIMRTLKQQPIAFNVHSKAISKMIFTNVSEATDFFRIISTNKDRNGTVFISTFEAKHYPIYCFQWQPEKILYVWNPVLAIDHSPDSIRVAQYIANFFIVEARKNSHRFATREQEEAKVIYPYKPLYIGNITESPYEQIYTFKHANATDFGPNVPEHFVD